MEFDITRLLSNIDKSIDVDVTYSFSSDELKNTGILKLDDVSIKGVIKKDALNEIYIDVVVKGIMVLPCAITLKEVDYPFEVNIEGNVDEMLEDLDKNIKKTQNSLDILPIIWENILMEIPARVVSPGAEDIKLSGDGWKLINEEETNENPELAKLKDLL